MSGINDAQLLDKLVRKIVDQKVNNIIKGNKLAGKIHSINANGNRADVFINNSPQPTSNIPIRYGLTLKPNDEVWIERINFNDTDLEISSKRNVNNEQWGQQTQQTITWNTPILGNGWVNYGVGENPVGYYKNSEGIVRLRGMIKSGTINTTAFVLPSGYRPANKESLLVLTSLNTYARLNILPDGTVIPVTGNNAYISLNNITFSTIA